MTGVIVLLLALIVVVALFLTLRAGARGAGSGDLAQGEGTPTERPQPLPTSLPDLTLKLPEPARTQAWGLLSALEDASRQEAGLDARGAYLLRQTRDEYLPDTLRAYLALTDGARAALSAQGRAPETLLAEQLSLMERGVRETLRHDHAAADRLLTQGAFLRERFGEAEEALKLPVTTRRS